MQKPTKMVDDAQQWEDRAQETSDLVKREDDPVVRETLLSIVAAYKRLAELARARRRD
jgi:hypothetical protein